MSYPKLRACVHETERNGWKVSKVLTNVKTYVEKAQRTQAWGKLFILAMPCGLWSLSSPTKEWALAMKASSPNHWTAKVCQGILWAGFVPEREEQVICSQVQFHGRNLAEPGRLQSMGSQSQAWLRDSFLLVSPDVAVVKNLPASAADARDPSSIPGLGRSPGGGKAAHFSILDWKIPWTEEPGGLQSLGHKSWTACIAMSERLTEA